ncbi:helix-turn-helix domain-containing protein [Pararhizobium sp. IMCC21322]|uniref:helix-turn-helix domain-containing protein n=1 Tax=Pararhizobium sp. IMCC21322 TaxID=3067903 RepID=UPI00274254B6|nr:helix-turn-helix transcriptional regulator [Pararhizobium sp. IMCC21322]
MNAGENLAARLKGLRLKQGWSLDQLSEQCKLSRATLSRIENGDVSPTAQALGRLCATYRITLSRLMLMVETNDTPLLRREDQPVWEDKKTGFVRRSISPPSDSLMCEVLECTLAPGAEITYPQPPKAGMEHHLVLLSGELLLEVEGTSYELVPGDCLRYRLSGYSTFKAHKSRGARYHFIIL